MRLRRCCGQTRCHDQHRDQGASPSQAKHLAHTSARRTTRQSHYKVHDISTAACLFVLNLPMSPAASACALIVPDIEIRMAISYSQFKVCRHGTLPGDI